MTAKHDEGDVEFVHSSVSWLMLHACGTMKGVRIGMSLLYISPLAQGVAVVTPVWTCRGTGLAPT